MTNLPHMKSEVKKWAKTFLYLQAWLWLGKQWRLKRWIANK